MTHPIIPCCTPARSFRSGWTWNHAPNCPESPNVPIIEHVTQPVLDAIESHVAFTSDSLIAGALRVWHSHPSMCLCASCAYVDHWLDRDDDLGEEVLDG